MKKIGTFAPLFSLTSRQTDEYGIFENGIVFIDWLSRTHQSVWQLLPLHEHQLIPGSTERVRSPYKGYGVGLNPEYLSAAARQKTPSDDELAEFSTMQKDWIDDYTLFCVLRDKFGTDDWRLWDAGLKKRDGKALSDARKSLADKIKQYLIEQYQLHHSYTLMKRHAKERSITIIGDLAFYTSVQSPLVWANQACFIMDTNYVLPRVSGVAYKKNVIFGRQIWGHPLYNWQESKSEILELWKRRLRYAATLFDHLRFDHANGFYTYGAIDPKDESRDEMLVGPGENVFSELVLYARSVGLDVFAEDLALHLIDLRSSMKKFAVSGVRVLRFAYDDSLKKINDEYLATEQYPYESIAYTTNHDTESLIGFLPILPDGMKQIYISKFLGRQGPDRDLAIAIRKAVIASPSRISIIPIQDWLLTGDRVNTPGTEKIENDPNWQYKVAMPIEHFPDIHV